MGGDECINYLECVNFTHIHHVVYFKNDVAQPKYIQFLFVRHTSIKLGKNQRLNMN